MCEIECYKNTFFPWNLTNYKYIFRMKGKTDLETSSNLNEKDMKIIILSRV